MAGEIIQADNRELINENISDNKIDATDAKKLAEVISKDPNLIKEKVGATINNLSDINKGKLSKAVDAFLQTEEFKTLSELEKNALSTLKIMLSPKVSFDNQINTKELQPDAYQQCIKNLFDFMKNRKQSNNNYHFNGIWPIEAKDYAQKFHNFDVSSVGSLVDDYNNQNPQNTIQKESFITSFRKNKLIPVSEKTSKDQEKSIDYNVAAKESQKESEFVLSPDQKQKIQDNIKKISDNLYDVPAIVLKGEASGQIVTDNGRIKAENFIADTLLMLKNKGFDTSKLPTYDQIKNQPWFNAEKEAVNPGNHAWAYGRSLLQLTALSDQDLRLISNAKIDFAINSNSVTGDAATSGGIEFFVQSPKTKTPEFREKNELLKKWLTVKFNISCKENNKYISNTFKADFDNKTAQDPDLVLKSRPNSAPNYTGWGSTNKLEKNDTTGVVSVYMNLTKQQFEKYQAKLSDQSNMSFEDYCSLYKDVAGTEDPNLNQLNKDYHTYQELQAQIRENIKVKKLN